jgi:hypothetical protein
MPNAALAAVPPHAGTQLFTVAAQETWVSAFAGAAGWRK